MSEAVREALRRYQLAVVAEAVEALDSSDFALIDLPLREGLRRYLEDRIETGSFLRAFLENDLAEAIGRAHPSLSMPVMRTLYDLMTGFFPQTAWGSPEKVAAWLAPAQENR